MLVSAAQARVHFRHTQFVSTRSKSTETNGVVLTTNAPVASESSFPHPLGHPPETTESVHWKHCQLGRTAGSFVRDRDFEAWTRKSNIDTAVNGYNVSNHKPREIRKTEK